MTARTDGTVLRLSAAIGDIRRALAELALLEPRAPAEVAAFLAMLRRYLDACVTAEAASARLDEITRGGRR